MNLTTRMADGFDRARMLERNLERQIEAIRAADTKIVLLVPTATAMIGVLAALLRDSGLAPLSMAYVVLATLPIVTSYAFMAMAVIPRLRGPGQSLLYFGGISTRSLDAYRDTMLGLGTEGYLSDLAEQCHVTAGIARSKHRHVRHAYLAFFLALPFWAFAVYLLRS
jgi:hypothetical protein